MAGTFTNLLYHIVFSTKNRDPLITPALQSELYPYIGSIIRSERGILLEIGGVADHVHLLAKFRPDIAISDMLKIIKANSSKWANLRPHGEPRFSWQDGYAAFSVSEGNVASVRQYLQSQERHHRKTTFKEELIMLLDKHRIPYDPKYIFL